MKKADMRKLQEKKKLGYGWDELLEECGWSKDEIISFAKGYYTKHEKRADDLINGIEKNTDRNRRLRERRANVDVPTPEPELLETVIADVEVVTVPDTLSGEEVLDAPQRSVKDQLAELRQEEESEANLLMGLESQRKSLVEQKKGCIIEMHQFAEYLLAIQADLQAKGDRFEVVASKSQKISAQMSAVSCKIQEHRAWLEEVRAEISDLERITIAVFADGTITLFEENSAQVILDDTGYEELVSDLFEEEACQNLRIKDATTMARLICIVRNLGSKSYWLVTEDEEIERAFEQLDF